MSEQKIKHFDLIGELIRLRKRVEALEHNRTGYSITGIIHLGVAEEEPTTGPSDGGAYLWVGGTNAALKYIGPANIPTQVAP
jgi:hypothetical protein